MFINIQFLFKLLTWFFFFFFLVCAFDVLLGTFIDCGATISSSTARNVFTDTGFMNAGIQNSKLPNLLQLARIEAYF